MKTQVLSQYSKSLKSTGSVDTLLMTFLELNLLLTPPGSIPSSLAWKIQQLLLAWSEKSSSLTSPMETLEALNEFFFSTSNFRVSCDEDLSSLAPFCVFAGRQGSALLLAPVFVYLAQKKGLNVKLTRHLEICQFQWAGKLLLLNLRQGGRVIDKKEAEFILKQKPGLDIKFQDWILIYLEQLTKAFQEEKTHDRVGFLLNMILDINPSHLFALSQRALWLFEQGETRRALKDAEKYFSLTKNQKNPCPQMKMLLHEAHSLLFPKPTPATFH